MKNKQLAELFEEIATILEILDDNIFRINSYKKASRILSDLTQDIEVLAKENVLEDIPGVGKGIAEKIQEFITTGHIKQFEQLKKKIPPGLLDIMSIVGMGAKTTKLLYKELKVKSVADLEKELKKGSIHELPGMGEKKEDNILRGIRLFKESSQRRLLGKALLLVEKLINNLKKNSSVKKISPAGSLRRMKETIGDIDILVAGKNGQQIIDHFTKGEYVKEILASGTTKGSIITDEGLQVDLRVVDNSCFGAALQYFTGSKEHNVKLRELARKKGYKINEYGIYKGEKKAGGKTEKEIYNKLGLTYIPPTLREDRGEVEAALENKLPKIIELSDIKGDLHCHTNWSDGASTIEDIGAAAIKLGYEYCSITDHSQSLKIAGGLSEKELSKQIEAIKNFNKKHKKFKLLCSTEVDIKSNGEIDFSKSLLKDLDIVVASIHYGFKQSEEKLTTRILKAMDNPFVNIIGHPTGRLINAREPYALNIQQVLTHASQTNTALEINSYYDRLDLSDIHCKKAKELGVRLAIGTDAHHSKNLWMMSLGVSVAQRGWLEKKNVLNTLTAEQLLKTIKKK